mmetsp:Transcript_51008/g.119285  ORF Transcript_51008/g.119285 Transcript_51008/m.119285 type:complete len:252 (+) Transcript_51008:59-814(+)
MFKAKQEILARLSKGEIEAFYYTEPVLQCDRQLLLAAVIVEGYALAYATPAHRCDREIVLRAVSSNGTALQHASSQLAADREIALAAVRQNGAALEYVDEELTHDREIVMIAIADCGWALSFAADEFRQDRDMVLAAIAHDPQVLQTAAEVILEDATFAIGARQSLYFFRISLMSGRSCTVALDDDDNSELADGVRSLLLMECCSKLGLEFRGKEVLVHGVEIVPNFTCIHAWPGSPLRGSVTEFQLVVGS